MKEPTRRAWSRPELIVIARSGPEEAVLQGCKSWAVGLSGPNDALNYCRQTHPTNPGDCVDCNATLPS